MLRERVSIVIPARNEEQTVASVVLAVKNHPSVDEVIVVDSASKDNTSVAAEAVGAKVVRVSQPGLGRALKAGFAVARNRLIVKIDADMTNVSGQWISLLLDKMKGNTGLVKAFWDNPEDPMPVTNLVVKPALKVLLPELAFVEMPISGIYLCDISVFAGQELPDNYAIDLEILIRCYRLGLGIEQVYLGQVFDRLRAISEYRDMSAELLAALHQQVQVQESGPLLLVMAHADDAEIWCGGTLLSYLSAGGLGEVWIATGDEQRNNEANLISSVFGNLTIKCLSRSESSIFSDNQAVSALAETISNLRPKAIICHHYADPHPDHRACFELVNSALMKVNRQSLPDALYLCNSYFNGTSSPHGTFAPNTYVDISSVSDFKYELIKKHASQDVNYWIAMAKCMDQLNGAKTGVGAAEAFERVSFYTLPRSRQFLR